MSNQIVHWTNELETGIKSIDEQHMKLIDIINDLYTAFIDKQSTIKLNDILARLAEYTDYHFNTEERIFKMYKYTDINNHIAEHKFFVEQLWGFQKALKNETTITFRVVSFLKKWIVDHIKGVDRQYISFMKEHNIR